MAWIDFSSGSEMAQKRRAVTRNESFVQSQAVVALTTMQGANDLFVRSGYLECTVASLAEPEFGKMRPEAPLQGSFTGR